MCAPNLAGRECRFQRNHSTSACQRWAPGGGRGTGGTECTSWVKTDVFAVLLAVSVFTYALRGTFCTPCTPQVPTDACPETKSPPLCGKHVFKNFKSLGIRALLVIFGGWWGGRFRL